MSPVEDKSLDEMHFRLTETPRTAVFDSNSFGLGALAPIAASDPDSLEVAPSASSKYRTDDSSRKSSLSFHNLDYKSSISSGSEYSGVNNFKSGDNSTSGDKTVNLASFQLESSQFLSFGYLSKGYESLYSNKTYLSSVPHFNTGK